MKTEEGTPLTPVSMCEGSSPLDTLRLENEELRREIRHLNQGIDVLKKKHQMKTGTRVLDLQTRQINYRNFLQEKGLTEEFKKRFNY